jgi:hypothetical protein
LGDFGEWIEHLRWIAHMSETAWIFSTVSVVHYFSFMVLVGTAVMVDLRVLGWAATRKPLVQLADQLYPWMWVAFWLAIISGSLEAATDAGDYLPNFWYELKIAVVILALIFVVIVRRGIPKWAQLPSIPMSAKVVAAIAAVLWIGAILAGVELPAITGLG